MPVDDDVPALDRLQGDELFELAERAADLLGGPVTVEDAASRVQAYSLHDDGVDAARTRTIVSRQVPEEVLAHFRARGVFRRLARSDAPLHVPEGPEGILPRVAVPVRVGGEWLGSVWAVRTDPLDDGVLDELRPVVRRIGLHLLRLRSQADLERHALGEHLRAALRSDGSALHPPAGAVGPWRVVAFTGPTGLGAIDDAPRRLDVWDSALRRSRWWFPQLTVLDGSVLGVVTDPADAQAAARPGAWPWLRRTVRHLHEEEPGLAVAAGGVVERWTDLAGSRAQAVELAGLVTLSVGGTGDGGGGRTESARGAPGTGRADRADKADWARHGAVRSWEESWRDVVVARAVGAVTDVATLGGPIAALAAHDHRTGSQHVATLVAALDNPGDPRAAAAALHVHPNTFRYRMRRIAELLDVDLGEPRTRFALRLQAEALRAAGGGRGEGPGSARAK